MDRLLKDELHPRAYCGGAKSGTPAADSGRGCPDPMLHRPLTRFRLAPAGLRVSPKNRRSQDLTQDVNSKEESEVRKGRVISIYLNESQTQQYRARPPSSSTLGLPHPAASA